MTNDEFNAAQQTVQGYVLHGHKRSHIWCALLRFKPDAPKQELRKQLQDLGASVTSGSDIVGNKARKDYVVRSIGLTWPGYQAIGLSNYPERFSPEFQQGFAARAETVTHRNPNKDGWDFGEWNLDARYHALFIFAAGTSDSAQQSGGKNLDGSADDVLLTKIQADINEKFKDLADWVTWLKGFLKRDKNGFTTENFGFADGISDPVFKPNLSPAGPSIVKPETFSSDAGLPLAFVREPFPGGKGSSEYGSYLAFLNIEQHVDKFKAATRCLASALGKSSTDAAALIIGRRQDGSPLTGVGTTSQSTEQIRQAIVERHTAAGISTGVTNELKTIMNNFGSKQPGDLWPNASHIRKMNPRTDPSRRIVRRSCVYADEEKNRRGVLFQCFQASLAQQFEFLMSAWANNTTQPVDGCGVDPIVGHDPLGRPQEWPTGEKTKNGEPKTIPLVVTGLTTIRGGEYFYFPSIPSLKNLANL